MGKKRGSTAGLVAARQRASATITREEDEPGIARLTSRDVAEHGTDRTYLLFTESGSEYRLFVPERSRGAATIDGRIFSSPAEITVGGVVDLGLEAADHSTVIRVGSRLIFGKSGRNGHTNVITAIFDITNATEADIDDGRRVVAADEHKRIMREAPPVFLAR